MVGDRMPAVARGGAPSMSAAPAAFDLTGRVALVTGGSRGLGRGMATALALAGAHVVLAARDEAHLAAAVADITAAGGKASSVAVDVADLDQIAPLIQRAARITGQLDILVTSAATQVRKPAFDVTPADWDRLMAVNLRAVFFCCQHAGRVMRQQGGGKIINIASLTAVGAWPNVAPYGASKGGVVQLTKALALEWAPDRINVNAIGPGTFRTELTEALYADAARSSALTARIPWGRPGTPADLGGAVVYLASSASDYVTGHVLYVDGGWLLS